MVHLPNWFDTFRTDPSPGSFALHNEQRIMLIALTNIVLTLRTFVPDI